MEGDAKSRTAVRRLHQRNPAAQIVVMGCYATRDPNAVAKLPGVVRVVTDKGKLADELRDFGVTTLPAGITRFDDHQRAFVKVQDGCLLKLHVLHHPVGSAASAEPGARSDCRRGDGAGCRRVS